MYSLWETEKAAKSYLTARCFFLFPIKNTLEDRFVRNKSKKRLPMWQGPTCYKPCWIRYPKLISIKIPNNVHLPHITVFRMFSCVISTLFLGLRHTISSALVHMYSCHFFSSLIDTLPNDMDAVQHPGHHGNIPATLV